MKENKYLDKIEYTEHSNLCGPLCGYGGRRFKNADTKKVIRETLEWEA